MMKLPSFELLQPVNRQELQAWLKLHRGRVKLCAGGTDLLVGMKRRLYPVSYLLSLQKLSELAGIVYDEKADRLEIGALTTLAELEESPLLARLQPGIAAAVKQIAAPPLRNRATLGGNLCLDTRCYYFNQSAAWRKLAGPCFKSRGDKCLAVPGGKTCRSVFSADLPILLIALEAIVVVAGPAGERSLPLAGLYTGDGAAPFRLEEGEVLVRVVLEGLRGKFSCYKKFRLRRALDFPLVGVALAGERNLEKRFVNPHVVLGAVASGPQVVSEAAQVLAGRAFDDVEAVRKAAAALSAAARPVANVASKPFYRKKMAGLLLEKIASELATAPEEVA
jgi:4-hydroxybenzoyl-CoA reductase subunit beta